MFRKSFSIILIVAFFASSLTPVPKASASELLGLPVPGTMVSLSPTYHPVLIKGLTVHKDNPFLFDFIVDVGQDKASGQALKTEGERLIKYFLASLAMPEKDLWVNLSPYEKDRTIPEELSKTDMGRDLLAQDYILKQITASLIYPEKQLGKTFWERVYSKAQALYGTTEIPVNTFNKVWIMADKAEVFEHDQTAFVTESHLKVMLEEDYEALKKNNPSASSRGLGREISTEDLSSRQSGTRDDAHAMASEIVRQVILPTLEQEINQGRHFAPLRQIFNSLILASWYKKNLKTALLNQVYSNQSKVKGIDLKDQTIKEQIYQRYLTAYKKGVFNYIKEDINTASGQTMPRKYFSGGMQIAPHDLAMTTDPSRVTALMATVTALVLMATVCLSGADLPANVAIDRAMTTQKEIDPKVVTAVGQALGPHQTDLKDDLSKRLEEAFPRRFIIKDATEDHHRVMERSRRVMTVFPQTGDHGSKGSVAELVTHPWSEQDIYFKIDDRHYYLVADSSGYVLVWFFPYRMTATNIVLRMTYIIAESDAIERHRPRDVQHKLDALRADLEGMKGSAPELETARLEEINRINGLLDRERNMRGAQKTAPAATAHPTAAQGTIKIRDKLSAIVAEVTGVENKPFRTREDWKIIRSLGVELRRYVGSTDRGRRHIAEIKERIDDVKPRYVLEEYELIRSQEEMRPATLKEQKRTNSLSKRLLGKGGFSPDQIIPIMKPMVVQLTQWLQLQDEKRGPKITLATSYQEREITEKLAYLLQDGDDLNFEHSSNNKVNITLKILRTVTENKEKDLEAAIRRLKRQLILVLDGMDRAMAARAMAAGNTLTLNEIEDVIAGIEDAGYVTAEDAKTLGSLIAIHLAGQEAQHPDESEHIDRLRQRINALFDRRNVQEKQQNIADKAAVAKGGIDLNANAIQWSIRKDPSTGSGQAAGVEMNVDPALIERIKREGIDSLTPVIFRVTPIVSIWPLIGLEPPKKEEERLAGV